ncbi:hypothetical protein [Meridianimarinicoccus roseus]|nr:hypothetical protein [Meridianimarinicoccus roseus]
MMALVADILLIAGALGAGFYCFVLSRKLSHFKNLETGVGGAITALSAQVEEMTAALEKARADAQSSTTSLDESSQRAELAAAELRQLMQQPIPPSPLKTGPFQDREPPAEKVEPAQPTFRRRRANGARPEPEV